MIKNIIKAFSLLRSTLTVVVLLNTMLFAQDQASDPWEGMNRAIFEFNDTLDIYVAEPVARVYDYVLPQPVIKGIDNFFYNLKFPSRFFSDAIQFKVKQTWHHTGRFLINSTIGVLGIFDVAKEFGLERHDEDFGTALAYWGVPAGPYFVIPILGPSNVRDAVGLLVDTVLNPVFWVPYGKAFDDKYDLGFSFGVATFDYLNKRARNLELVETAKDSSLDYYLFVRSAYYQYRNAIVFDGEVPGEGDDWLEDEEEFGGSSLPE